MVERRGLGSGGRLAHVTGVVYDYSVVLMSAMEARNNMKTNEEIWAAKPKKERGKVARFFTGLMWFIVIWAISRNALELLLTV